MVSDGTYAATVDRIEEGRAVVLVERDGEVVDEFLVDADRLPADAGEGTVLEIELRSGELRDLRADPDTTEERRRRLRDRFDRLSERPPDGDDPD